MCFLHMDVTFYRVLILCHQVSLLKLLYEDSPDETDCVHAQCVYIHTAIRRFDFIARLLLTSVFRARRMRHVDFILVN